MKTGLRPETLTDLTDGLTLFFPSSMPSIQRCPASKSRPSTPSPIHRTGFVPTPWSAPASSIIQPEREATCAQSPGRAGSLGDIWIFGGMVGSWRLCSYASNRMSCGERFPGTSLPTTVP